jgi:pimeloyl-ACP methyl ester carboxylesterase
VTHFALIGGHMCDARLWAKTEAALYALGHSHQVVDIGQDQSLGDMATRALDALPETFVPIGFSMGGMVAFEVFRKAPDRLKGLVLLDTHAAPDLKSRAKLRLSHQTRVRAGGLEDVVKTAWLTPSFAKGDPNRDALKALILDMALSEGPEVFLRQSEALRLRADCRPLLSQIKVPTLIMCGADDELCPPKWQKTMQQSLEKAELHIIENAGHFALLQNSDAYLGWLLTWASHTINS